MKHKIKIIPRIGKPKLYQLIATLNSYRNNFDQKIHRPSDLNFSSIILKKRYVHEFLSE